MSSHKDAPTNDCHVGFTDTLTNFANFKKNLITYLFANSEVVMLCLQNLLKLIFKLKFNITSEVVSIICLVVSFEGLLAS